MNNIPYYRVKLDLQNPLKQFHFYCFCGDTPILRAMMYRDGEKWTPNEDWTATIGYGTNFEYSTSIHEVTGYPGYYWDSSSSSSDSSEPNPPETDYNYFEFQFAASDIATPGDYYAQIIIRNATDTERYVFGVGMIHIKDSPIGGSHTDLTLTSVVNWDNITNTGTVPWDSSTAVIEDTDCSVNPIECSVDDHGKTYIWNGACNMVYTLPALDDDNVGIIFKFINLTSYVVEVRAQSGETIDTYPAMYTGEGYTNTNPSYARGSLTVKQIRTDRWGATEGRGIWTYLIT